MIKIRNKMSHRDVVIEKDKLKIFMLNTQGLGECTNQFILDNHYTTTRVEDIIVKRMQYFLVFLAPYENLVKN